MEEWAKLHTEILGEEKFMRAARKGARGLLLMPWLLAVAKRAKDGGRLTVRGEPIEYEDLELVIPGLTRELLQDALCSLVNVGTLTAVDGVYQFVNWERRQSRPAKPSDAPEATRERQRKSRSTRLLTPARESSRPVTPMSRPPVTPRDTGRVTRGDYRHETEDRRERPSSHGEDNTPLPPLPVATDVSALMADLSRRPA